MPRFMLDESQVNPDPFMPGADAGAPLPPPDGSSLAPANPDSGPLLVPEGGVGDTGPGFPPPEPQPVSAVGTTVEPPVVTPPENMPPNVPEVGGGGGLPELPPVVPAVPPGASLPMKKGTFALPGSRGARAALGGRTFGPAFTPSPLRTGPGVPLVGGSGGGGGGSITEAAAAAGMSPQDLIDQILRKLQSGA